MITVFLVDDHCLVRDGMARLLSTDTDIEVVGQSDSLEEAVTHLEKSLPDVLTLDLEMPTLGGRDGLSWLLSKFPELTVLVVSYRADPDEIQLLVELGARGYVCKDSPAEELARAVRALAGGKCYFCPTSASALAKSVAQHEGEPANPLTRRQLEVLRLISEGKTTREVADLLCLSPKTVEKYRSIILKRLGAKNVLEALKTARDLKLLS